MPRDPKDQPRFWATPPPPRPPRTFWGTVWAVAKLPALVVVLALWFVFGLMAVGIVLFRTRSDSFEVWFNGFHKIPEAFYPGLR